MNWFEKLTTGNQDVSDEFPSQYESQNNTIATRNHSEKTGRNNPMLTVIKSIALLFLLFIGVNTHSVLAKDTPNKTIVGHEKNTHTIGDSEIKAVQDLLAPLKSENLSNIEFFFIPTPYLLALPYDDEAGFFMSAKDYLKTPIEERTNFLFLVPKHEYLAVWNKINALPFTNIDKGNFAYRNYVISVRFTFDNHILYVSNYRFNQENISIRRGDTRIILNTHAMRDFVSIFDKYVEHPILKQSLYTQSGLEEIKNDNTQ